MEGGEDPTDLRNSICGRMAVRVLLLVESSYQFVDSSDASVDSNTHGRRLDCPDVFDFVGCRDDVLLLFFLRLRLANGSDGVDQPRVLGTWAIVA